MALSSRILIVENNAFFSAILCQQLAFEGFKNVIEVEINNFLVDKVFQIDSSEYTLALKIDTIGKFTFDNISPSDRLDKTSIIMIKNAIENIPNALPAIKTNVGEFVEVIFKLPFRLNYE